MTITYPPVLDDDADYAVEDMPDLLARLAALRERAPAAWVRSFGNPTVMFSSYELVNAAFKDEETFPSAAFYGNVVTDVLGRNLQCMYGDEHRRNRALVQPAFTPKRAQWWIDQWITTLVDEAISAFEDQGRRAQHRPLRPHPAPDHHRELRPDAGGSLRVP